MIKAGGMTFGFLHWAVGESLSHISERKLNIKNACAKRRQKTTADSTKIVGGSVYEGVSELFAKPDILMRLWRTGGLDGLAGRFWSRGIQRDLG